jgi:proteic killer suppression protein
LIRSFRDKATRDIFEDFGSRQFRAIEKAAKRRLDVLAAATDFLDLAAIRSNRLEALAGNRKGQHRIRINDQWRLCFVWKAGDAWNVEIIDYH